MPCKVIPLGGGGVVIACSRGRQARARCSVPSCDRPHTKLCDFRLADGRTCDAKVCGSHAHRQSATATDSVDFCPAHHWLARESRSEKPEAE